MASISLFCLIVGLNSWPSHSLEHLLAYRCWSTVLSTCEGPSRAHKVAFLQPKRISPNKHYTHPLTPCAQLHPPPIQSCSEKQAIARQRTQATKSNYVSARFTSPLDNGPSADEPPHDPGCASVPDPPPASAPPPLKIPLGAAPPLCVASTPTNVSPRTNPLPLTTVSPPIDASPHAGVRPQAAVLPLTAAGVLGVTCVLHGGRRPLLCNDPRGVKSSVTSSAASAASGPLLASLRDGRLGTACG